jgi:hypothetical protein
MPNIFQIRSVINGFTGGPGYNQLYFDAGSGTLGAQSATDAVMAFWSSLSVQMPSSVSIAVQNDVSKLDDSTGDLISVETVTGGTAGPGGSSAPYAAGVGACISWTCAEVHLNHRLRGRTFVVPLASAGYQSDGTLVDSVKAAIQTNAATLNGHADFGIWGRPVNGLNGLFGHVQAVNVRDKVAILRSRRD